MKCWVHVGGGIMKCWVHVGGGIMKCWVIRDENADEQRFSNGRDAPSFVTDKHRRVWFDKGLLKAHITRVAKYGSQRDVELYAKAAIVEMELKEVEVTHLGDKMRREMVLREL